MIVRFVVEEESLSLEDVAIVFKTVVLWVVEVILLDRLIKTKFEGEITLSMLNSGTLLTRCSSSSIMGKNDCL